MLSDEYIRNLLQAYLRNSLDAEQIEELFGYLERHPILADQLLKEITEIRENKLINQLPLKEEISKRMLQGLLTKINEAPVIAVMSSRFIYARRWIAAASILLIIGAAIYFISGSQPKNIANRNFINPQHSEKDALPGFDGAVLTTASGSQIVLDSAGNGLVSKEGNTNVIKQSNRLVYNESLKDVAAAEETYNTLSTLKGRKFQLVLADGTQVWLDAASSLTYPIAFNGMQRRVQASGQVYFEVAKDPLRPFIVEAGGMTVQVLGTHFNVNAYADEATMKTTLLEGEIKITKNNNSSLLKPGEQAVIDVSDAGMIEVNNSADLDAVMAWKNGLFQFTNADLTTVLRQLSRWYDMDIVYEGKMPEREFEGKIGRDLNLSQVLKLLEKVQVRFRIEGNKLIVQP